MLEANWRTVMAKITTTEAFANSWVDVQHITAEDIHEAEQSAGVELPQVLRSLLMQCAGGRPAKNYLYSESADMEVSIAYVLPVCAAKKRQDFSAELVQLSRAGLPSQLLPFAIDSGHANYFCLDVVSGAVVYWLHDEPDVPIKQVAADLLQFLSLLATPPY